METELIRKSGGASDKTWSEASTGATYPSQPQSDFVHWVFTVGQPKLLDNPGYLFFDFCGTGSSIVNCEPSDIAVPPQKSLAHRITSIRAAFGLSHSDMADLLNVTRATLYAWLDPSSVQKPQKGNEARIERLEHLADYWTRFSSLAPRKDLKSLLPSGASVFACLKEETPKCADACAAMRELSSFLREQAKTKPSSRAERLAKLGFRAPKDASAFDEIAR